jgi:hypothetical protein
MYMKRFIFSLLRARRVPVETPKDTQKQVLEARVGIEPA